MFPQHAPIVLLFRDHIQSDKLMLYREHISISLQIPFENIWAVPVLRVPHHHIAVLPPVKCTESDQIPGTEPMRYRMSGLDDHIRSFLVNENIKISNCKRVMVRNHKVIMETIPFNDSLLNINGEKTESESASKSTSHYKSIQKEIENTVKYSTSSKMDLLKSITLYHFFTEHLPPRCLAVIRPVKYLPPDFGIRAVRASALSWFQRQAISGRIARREPGVCPRSLRSPGTGCHAFCWLICRGLVGVVRISFQSGSGSWSMNWVMGSV